ncbi:MAG: hypothetical protein ACREWG_04305 [Gammaproteobacteria bacterium]
MLTLKMLNRSAIYSLTIAVYAAGQSVFAHTGVRDQATEGKTSYNGFTIPHGCRLNSTVPLILPVIGQSAVFPYGDASSSSGPTVWVDLSTNTVIPTGGTGIVSLGAPPALPIFSLSVGGIQQNDPFDIVQEETDPASPTVVRALNWQGSDEIYRLKRLKRGKNYKLLRQPFAGLRTELLGIPEFSVRAPMIIDDCVSSLRVRIAVANWCEKGQNEASDPENDRADWWFTHPVVAAGSAGAPGSGSTKFTDVDLTLDNFWTTLTVNNSNPRADPTTCPGGVLHEVAVQPAGTEIDTYLPNSPFTKEPAPY